MRWHSFCLGSPLPYAVRKRKKKLLTVLLWIPLTLRYLLVGGFLNESHLCNWHRDASRGAGRSSVGRCRSDMPSEDVRAENVCAEDVCAEGMRARYLCPEDLLPERALWSSEPPSCPHLQAQDL